MYTDTTTNTDLQLMFYLPLLNDSEKNTDLPPHCPQVLSACRHSMGSIRGSGERAISATPWWQECEVVKQ